MEIEEQAAITLGDLLVVFIIVILLGYIFSSLYTQDTTANATRIAYDIYFSLTQTWLAGEGSKSAVTLPKTFCEIKISKNEIYVNAEESTVSLLVKRFLSLFGITKSGEKVLPNPVGKHLKKDEISLSCDKATKKTVIIERKEGKLDVY